MEFEKAKREAVTAAKELEYPLGCLRDLMKATKENDLYRILKDARNGKYGNKSWKEATIRKCFGVC